MGTWVGWGLRLGGGRAGYWLVVVSLLVAAVAVVLQTEPSAVETRTDLAGLFSCSRGDGDGGEPSESDLDLFLDGLIDSLVSGSNFFTFQGLAPPGVPVAADPGSPPPMPDPVTGGTLFTRSLGSAQVGQGNGVDFLDPGVVPGAGGDELTFELLLRLAAGADGDDMGLERLFNQNFGLPDDPGGDIGVLGVDVDLTANTAMTELPVGFRGRFEGVFSFELPDGTPQAAGFRFELNSLAEGSAIPGESSLSFVVRERADEPTNLYYALGQTAEFAGFDGTANQPGVGFGLDLAFIEPGPSERDLVATDVGWAAAPRQAAFGFGQLCPTRGHVGWNLDPAGLPDPEAASLDVDFRLGDQVGQPITVDDGAGGSTEVRASEVVLDGRIDGLPSLMDFIMLGDALSFTRSAGVAPDVVVDRFHVAAEDPEREDELPLHVWGQLTAMARHVLFVAGMAPETGVVERAELTSWTLECDGEPSPPGPPAPDDVRLPDRTDTLPFFPAGCARHNLAPVPTAEVVVQNWLPEDLRAQAATADLRSPPLDADQFSYAAVRDVNSLSTDGLLAFGARINGLQRATVDLTTVADKGGRARVYVERDPGPAPADPARFVVDIDPEGDGGPGTHIVADATVDDLPDAVRVDYESLPGRSPLDVTWRADAPLAVSAGVFDAVFPGPRGFELHGAFETGAAGGGPLPPAARIQVTRGNSADRQGQVLYSAPAAPDDGFPTPDVPDYDPTTVARLHVGAELSMEEDRDANLSTRIHADIDVPQPIEVTWTRDAEGRVATVIGRLCDIGRDDPVCAPTRFDVTVVRGPRTAANGADLLTAPQLPVPTGLVSEAVPVFSEFRPGSGVRAVVLGPDAWGVDVQIHGLSQVVYRREPLDVRVRLAGQTVEQPFRVNLLDASKAVDTEFGPRPQVLFADAGIDRLPRAILIRQQDVDAASDRPWLWVNTEALGIRDIDDVDWTPDPAGTRPRLTGLLRLGDAAMLANTLPIAERPTSTRDGSVPGVDVWAGYHTDSGLIGVDASLSMDIPRHVAVWRPTQIRCEGSTDDPETCVYRRPSYELEHTDQLGVRFRTTSTEIGDLNLTGLIRGDLRTIHCGPGCAIPRFGIDLSARARIDRVPGTLQASLTIADNQRLPWLRVDLLVRANTSAGSVWAEVRDNNHKVEYRRDADPVNRGQCTEADDQCTANYAVALTNVPANFRITGQLQGYSEERLTPEPPSDEPPDPTQPETGLGGIGFVHAQLDLGGNVDRVIVQGREAADGQFVGTLEAFRPDDNDDSDPEPAPVSGFINARVDHVTVDLPRIGTDQADPFMQYFFDSGGVLGVGVCLPLDDDTCEEIAPWVGALGRVFLPMFIGFDLIAGFVLELLFEGDVVTDFDLDFDLPLFVGFDRVEALRLGQNGSTLSVDERHTAAGDPATIAVRQQSMDHEAELRVDGAYYHHRDVEYSYGSLLGPEDFDISNQATDALGDVGLYRHRDCEDPDFQGCYDVDFGSNAVTLDEVRSDPAEGRPGFDSADIVIDPIFTPENRAEIEDQGPGLVSPGDIYDVFAESSQPVPADAFLIPDLAIQEIDPQPASFGTTTYCCNTTTFRLLQGDPPPEVEHTYGPVCAPSDPQEVLDGSRAIGPDGTEYVVVRKASNAVPSDRERTICDATQLLLEAHYPRAGSELGPPRWSIALPTPAGLENPPGPDDDGECRDESVRCEIEIQVVPQADGSVQVEMTTEVFASGVDGNDLDLTVLLGIGHVDIPGSEVLRREVVQSCCREPELFTGDRSVLDPAFAWVDASGHPGFHLGAAVAVDDVDAVTVPIDPATGIAELDPCAIAPDFGCDSVPATHSTQWLFGDGTMTDEVSAGPSPQIHRYPIGAPNPAFLGILVHYNEAGEVVETAQFRPATT